jgi:hypothetical protein
VVKVALLEKLIQRSFQKTTMLFLKNLRRRRKMKGVKHYKKDGTVHTGSSHKMADGTSHTNKSHTKTSAKLFHFKDLSTKAKSKAKGK